MRAHRVLQELTIVTEKVLIATRPGRRALQHFRSTLEWMQTAAVLLLALYLGALLLV
jgi:hypothetical protein